MIIILTKLMFAPIHIQSNFHITLSSKPYLPTIKLESFLLNCKGYSIHNMFRVGRDQRVFSHGFADEKSEAITTSNIQLFAIDQRSLKENEIHKWIYGWNENGSDEGFLHAKYYKQMEEGQLLIMKAKLASLEGMHSFLELGKQKMKTIGDDLMVPKFCARLNLSTGVHIVKGL